MQFIEQLLGWDPDGGSGVVEALLILTAAAAVALWVRRRPRTAFTQGTHTSTTSNARERAQRASTHAAL
jgi:hypothetical protein